MSDDRTTELMRLLDERGVKYELRDFLAIECVVWNGNVCRWAALPDEKGLAVTVYKDYLTPEQAIAATLGSEQELIDLAHNAWSMALCAMQGMPIPADWGNAVEHGLRKYGINVDEELAGFEVIDDEW